MPEDIFSLNNTKMTIDIILTAKEIEQERVKGKTVVVIDVLRATSVMCTALANGAKEIIPVLTPEEAFDIQNKMGKDNVILGGERNAIPIEGFDFGNSPLSYTPEIIKDKTLVITTTNGTRAIVNSQSAKKLYVGSFSNIKAMVQSLKDEKEVVLVASGSHDLFTMEDSLCAGKIAYELSQITKANLSDVAIAMMNLYEQNEHDLHAVAAKGKHYQRLQSLGNQRDIDYCFKSDILNVVPVYKDGRLVVR